MFGDGVSSGAYQGCSLICAIVMRAFSSITKILLSRSVTSGDSCAHMMAHVSRAAKFLMGTSHS